MPQPSAWSYITSPLTHGSAHHGSWARLAWCVSLYSLQAKNGSYVFICLKKIKRIMFCDTWKLYENQISVMVNKFYGNTASYFLIYLLPVAACAL